MGKSFQILLPFFISCSISRIFSRRRLPKHPTPVPFRDCIHSSLVPKGEFICFLPVQATIRYSTVYFYRPCRSLRHAIRASSSIEKSRPPSARGGLSFFSFPRPGREAAAAYATTVVQLLRYHVRDQVVCHQNCRSILPPRATAPANHHQTPIPDFYRSFLPPPANSRGGAGDGSRAPMSIRHPFSISVHEYEGSHTNAKFYIQGLQFLQGSKVESSPRSFSK